MNNFKKALNKKNRRPNSVAIIGAFFGDEGKGRISDEITDYFLNKKNFKRIILYRDNGGANAGHTISHNGKKISLHQIGSGILHKGCHIVLGKGMVIHPSDLVEEINEVKTIFGFKNLPSTLLIDEMAVLSLDTHRAFEYILKSSDNDVLGSGASTNRGISPAYADILFRFPLRVRDLYKSNWEQLFTDHFDRYANWIRGMESRIEEIRIQRYKGKVNEICSKDKFIENLNKSRTLLKPYVFDVCDFINYHWKIETPFIFEKAQAIGLDSRWGVYPDISASNCCLDGITYSTEGIIDGNDIAARLGVIKSTYTSSVGTRIVPTMMDESNAQRIREIANEYGSTTGRPRDILHLDLVMLKYFCKVSGIDSLVFTHMDVVNDSPIKVCVNYNKNGVSADYRPDQMHMSTIDPVYKEFKSWNPDLLKEAKNFRKLPDEAKSFIKYVSNYTETQPAMLTYGPERNSTLLF